MGEILGVAVDLDGFLVGLMAVLEVEVDPLCPAVEAEFDCVHMSMPRGFLLGVEGHVVVSGGEGGGWCVEGGVASEVALGVIKVDVEGEIPHTEVKAVGGGLCEKE